jgi:hypothetical protein
MSMPANLPGIWVSYQRPDGLRSLVAMAGGGRPDGIIAVTDEQRVGVRHVAVPGSSPPASVIEVVFHGSNAAGAGIFRAIIAVNAADGQPLGAPVLESLLRIGRPLPVGPGGAITSLDLYDPINQSGTILVRATLGTDTALVRILADSDGDGLLDNWETDGIPYTKADGTPDRYILPGANVLHKDLYVEVDSMSGLSLGASAKAMVEAAFANAPSPEITNPDGRPGINLHVILDDQNITAFEAQSAIVGSGWPTKASSLKRDWFGTATDRLDLANVAAIQAARAKAFRYCLVINNVANRLYGGLAELGGDDFVICVGGLSDEDKASVFMHEVGHTLGLDHGGGDDINGKPNYPSIMNYLLAYRNGRTWWRLDYSRCAMVTLDEYDLDETQVVTGIDHDCAVYTDYWLPINVVPVSTCGLFTAGQPITQKVYLDGITRSDYNGNCLTVDRDVAGQDLNNLATACPVGQSSCPSPDEPFVGYNDWQRVSLPFLNPSTASFAAAQAEEPTLEQYARLDVLIRSLSSGQCVADFNADGFLTFEDFDTFVTAFEAGNATADFNADGFLTFEDFDAFVAAFEAGC